MVGAATHIVHKSDGDFHPCLPMFDSVPTLINVLIKLYLGSCEVSQHRHLETYREIKIVTKTWSRK
jgi:hypothetical protein